MPRRWTRWLGNGQALVTFPKTPGPLRAVREPDAWDGIRSRTRDGRRLGDAGGAPRPLQSSCGGARGAIRCRDLAERGSQADRTDPRLSPKDPARWMGRFTGRKHA